MRTRTPLLATAALPVLVLAVLLSACGALPLGKVPLPASDPGEPPLVLVDVTDGLAGVPAGSSEARWSQPGAVAAPDGSAAFSAWPTRSEDGRLRTVLSDIDFRTGHSRPHAVIDGSLAIAAVAPDFRWIALTERSPSSTKLAVVDQRTLVRRHDLAGEIEPEAFSRDGMTLFALRRFPDHYRVVGIDLTTGAVRDLLSRDKNPGADMSGSAVAAVMAADRRVLATLYRNPPEMPGHPGHAGSTPLFVHLLDLDDGATYCVDLGAPFGTGAPLDDVIVGEGNIVTVGSAAGTVVRIDTGPFLRGEPGPVPVTIEEGPAPRWPAGVTATGGFERVVAVVP